MPLPEIMQNIHVKEPPPAVAISGLTHDSRRVSPGNLFVALPGRNVQGTDFVSQALERGAAAIAGPVGWDSPLLHPAGPEEPPAYIELDDLPAAFSQMAANYYRHPSRSLSVVGITGTNGKTTTAELLTAILRSHGQPTATLGTLGLRWDSQERALRFTTPEAVELHRIFAQLADNGARGVVMEVSSHALKQSRVDHVDFDAAVFTNLTQDHLDYHPDVADYLASKLRLFQLLAEGRPAIVNRDDPSAHRFIQAARGPVITFGRDQLSDLRVGEMGMNLELTVANLEYQGGSFAIESRLVGAHNLENILAATATGLAMGVPVTAIQDGIAAVRAVAGRLEAIPSAAPGMVLIDYAHTPDAYRQLLLAVRQLTPAQSRLITLFGCGGDRDRAKRPLMAAQAEKYSDQLIITSDNPRSEPLDQINADIVKGLSTSSHLVIADRREALIHALGMMTEETVLLILGKGREDYELIGAEKVPHSDVDIVGAYTP